MSAETSGLIAALAQAVEVASAERRNQPLCTCPTDSDIDAALDAANDRLTRKD